MSNDDGDDADVGGHPVTDALWSAVQAALPPLLESKALDLRQLFAPLGLDSPEALVALLRDDDLAVRESCESLFSDGHMGKLSAAKLRQALVAAVGPIAPAPAGQVPTPVGSGPGSSNWRKKQRWMQAAPKVSGFSKLPDFLVHEGQRLTCVGKREKRTMPRSLVKPFVWSSKTFLALHGVMNHEDNPGLLREVRGSRAPPSPFKPLP